MREAAQRCSGVIWAVLIAGGPLTFAQPHANAPATIAMGPTTLAATGTAAPTPTPASTPTATPAPAPPLTSAAPDGEAVFRRVCAACHLGLPEMGAAANNPLGARAVPREFLHQYPPEAILNALTQGKMQAQGAALSPAERSAVAQFAAGRSFGTEKPVDPATEAGSRCTDAPGWPARAGTARWNGWGNGVANTRFQSASAGGLTAAQLPQLKLKWAFGFVDISSARTQPAVLAGRVFVASENGQVHSLSAERGCSYWSFTAQSGIVTALSIGPYVSHGKTQQAVYFGDRKANAYAVDAQTGALVWTRKVDEHPAASITGAPTVYGGRVYVPVQGVGEEGRGARGDYACCTFRGSVSAIDASTGRLVWKTYTVPPAEPRGKNKEGVQIFGPAGGGIWSAPTVDARRGLLYVSTGNGYAEPAQPTTDAVLALDLHSGAVRWVRQLLAKDIWVMGCDAQNSGNPACPQRLGPDYDFSAPPALVRTQGRELLVLPQKSGMTYALDPAHQGRLLWQHRIGQGSGLGGQWGTAIAGDLAFFGVADALTPRPGGMHALRLADGEPAWEKGPPEPLCAGHLGCSVGQGAAPTAIPGAVLSGALDGAVRAYSTRDGSILWTYDTRRDFTTVNGVKAHGGGIDGPGPIVAGGMMLITSGSGGFLGQPGNVLIALGLDSSADEPVGSTR